MDARLPCAVVSRSPYAESPPNGPSVLENVAEPDDEEEESLSPEPEALPDDEPVSLEPVGVAFGCEFVALAVCESEPVVAAAATKGFTLSPPWASLSCHWNGEYRLCC